MIEQDGLGQWEEKAAAMTSSEPGVRRTGPGIAYVWHSSMKREPRWAKYAAAAAKSRWSKQERDILVALVKQHGANPSDWEAKACAIRRARPEGPMRTTASVRMYYHKALKGTALLEGAASPVDSSGCVCPHCGKVCADKGRLRQHIGSSRCKSATANTASSAGAQGNKHVDDGNVACEKCGKVVGRRGLHRHVDSIACKEFMSASGALRPSSSPSPPVPRQDGTDDVFTIQILESRKHNGRQEYRYELGNQRQQREAAAAVRQWATAEQLVTLSGVDRAAEVVDALVQWNTTQPLVAAGMCARMPCVVKCPSFFTGLFCCHHTASYSDRSFVTARRGAWMELHG
jgi:hypothetical protein